MDAIHRRTARRLAAALPFLAPLAASAGAVAGGAEEGADAAWRLLAATGPAMLWGLPLAYLVLTVASRLPRRPPARTGPEGPRGAISPGRRSLRGGSREGR